MFRNLNEGIRYRTVLTVEVVFIDLKNGLICILMILACLYFIKVDAPNLVILIRHLYLSGMRFGVAPRTDTKKPCVEKRLDCVLKV